MAQEVYVALVIPKTRIDVIYKITCKILKKVLKLGCNVVIPEKTNHMGKIHT